MLDTFHARPSAGVVGECRALHPSGGFSFGLLRLVGFDRAEFFPESPFDFVTAIERGKGFGRYLAMLYDAAGFSSGVRGHIGRKDEILPSFDSQRRQVR